MKNKKLLIFSLVFPVIVLLLWTLSLTYYHHSEKRTVLIAVTGYDPRDLVSGHYVQLQPDWNATDCTQFEDNICPKKLFRTSYRYFLPQNEAKNLEVLLANRSQALSAQLQFIFIPNQEPVLKDLFLEGMVWNDWKAAKTQPKE